MTKHEIRIQKNYDGLVDRKIIELTNYGTILKYNGINKLQRSIILLETLKSKGLRVK